MSKPLRAPVEPPTYFADPGDMRRWLASAAPGETAQYASGPNLGRGDNPAAELARIWRDRGAVALKQERDKQSRRFIYLMERLSDPATARATPPEADNDKPVRPRLPDDPAWAESIDGQVFRLIARFAAADRPCPSNQTIAELLQLDNHETARYRFNRLVRAGHLRLIEGNRFGARIVEIAATGKRTAPIQEKTQ